MSSLTALVPIPAGINTGLNGLSNRLTLSVLGNPRSTYSSNCQPVTNPALKPHMVTKDVGPFKVTGYDKAVDSLKDVMDEINTAQSTVYAALGSAGMLCCRLVRGSTHSISNHSWGCAVDVSIGGVVDTRGDGLVQVGLTLIAPIFNKHKWYWGAGFPTEDGMHFEVCKELLLSWKSGVVPVGTTNTDDKLTLGDRNHQVLELQKKLNAHGETLDEDGIFGLDTLAAVRAFQAVNGLNVDGVVSPDTMAKL
jgi:hypothetical protein